MSTNDVGSRNIGKNSMKNSTQQQNLKKKSKYKK